MKQNTNTTRNSWGFTLIELMVVISIMLIAFSVVLVGLNQQQIKRSVILSQNETVTTIRKVQSYMLSSRDVPTSKLPARYYILYLQKNSPSSTVRAVDSSYAFYDNLEKINFTSGVIVNKLTLTQKDGSQSTPTCAQVIFSAPFGKMYIDTTEPCDGSIINTLISDPAALIQRADRTLTVELANPRGG